MAKVEQIDLVSQQAPQVLPEQVRSPGQLIHRRISGETAEGRKQAGKIDSKSLDQDQPVSWPHLSPVFPLLPRPGRFKWSRESQVLIKFL